MKDNCQQRQEERDLERRWQSEFAQRFTNFFNRRSESAGSCEIVGNALQGFHERHTASLGNAGPAVSAGMLPTPQLRGQHKSLSVNSAWRMDKNPPAVAEFSRNPGRCSRRLIQHNRLSLQRGITEENWLRAIIFV